MKVVSKTASIPNAHRIYVYVSDPPPSLKNPLQIDKYIPSR